MKKLLTTVVMGATFLLASCGTKTTSVTTTTQENSVKQVQLTDGSETVEVNTNPKKIVTFDLGAADTLRAIGQEEAIAGIPTKTLPTYIKNLGEKVQNVGSMKEPDIEAIAAMQPDLIIASTRTKDFIPQLKEIAPTVIFNVDSKDYWGSVQKNVKSLASLFNEEAQQKAAAQVKELQTVIDSIASQNEKHSEKSLAIMLNEGKMSAFGAQSRFGFLYQDLKFRPTDAKIEESRHGQEISFEGVSELNPDVLFVLNRTLAIGGDNSKADALMKNELIQATNAVKNNKVVNLTSDLWYLSGGGLESTKLMLQDLQHVFQ